MITKPESKPWTRHHAAWAALGLITVGAIVVSILSLRTPPQMGPDEEVFNTVDALYTAVRNQDVTQLNKCEARLQSYKEVGKLPTDSANYLNTVIAKARTADWDAAAQRLYDFMLAQRRDGFDGHHDKKPKSPKGQKKPGSI